MPALKDYVKNSLNKFNISTHIIELCTNDDILDAPEKYPVEVIENPRIDLVFLTQQKIIEIYPFEPFIDISSQYISERVPTV